jgi:hypothetical protein
MTFVLKTGRLLFRAFGLLFGFYGFCANNNSSFFNRVGFGIENLPFVLTLLS